MSALNCSSPAAGSGAVSHTGNGVAAGIRSTGSPSTVSPVKIALSPTGSADTSPSSAYAVEAGNSWLTRRSETSAYVTTRAVNDVPTGTELRSTATAGGRDRAAAPRGRGGDIGSRSGSTVGSVAYASEPRKLVSSCRASP